MKPSTSPVVLLLSATVLTNAQQSAWGQCGGNNWSGATTCVSGYTCSVLNEYYSQCVPSTGSTKAATSATNPPSSTSTVIKVATSSSATSVSSPLSSTAIRYLISFGDSYSQTGFDPKQSLASASNPLGNPTFPGYTTTGGANWIGYYITQFNPSPVYSYNFAYGGATTDANLVKPFASTVLSLVDQVNEYVSSTKTISGFVRWNASNSLFAIWIGVNDVGNAWGQSDYQTLLGKIITQYMNQVQTLYNNGARKFLFLTVPPINLTPSVLAQGSSASGEVTAIKQYSTALQAAVAKFAAANPGVKTWIVDTQKPFLTALNNPTAYGAPNASCYDASGTKCLWWNDYHPGQAIQKLVAQAVAATVGN